MHDNFLFARQFLMLTSISYCTAIFHLENDFESVKCIDFYGFKDLNHSFTPKSMKIATLKGNHEIMKS